MSKRPPLRTFQQCDDFNSNYAVGYEGDLRAAREAALAAARAVDCVTGKAAAGDAQSSYLRTTCIPFMEWLLKNENRRTPIINH